MSEATCHHARLPRVGAAIMRGSLLLATLLSSAGLSYASNDFGKRFLEENKARPGVVTLDSGLQYFVLEEGDGDVHPLRDTDCVCHYEGRTAQAWSEVPKGKKFDSSFDRGTPSNFAPSGVIRGWTEAMQMMVTGDKWELYIPSEMAYGEQGQGGDIGPGDVLVFTLHLKEIRGESTPAEPRGPPRFETVESVAELTAWVDGAGGKPLVLGLFKQPVAKAKLAGAFKAAAKADASSSYALSAVSKFEKGKYTVSPVEAHYGASAPSVLIVKPGKGKDAVVAKCKLGRPTEASKEELVTGITACASQHGGGAKAEL